MPGTRGRRGPWGKIQRLPQDFGPSLVIDGLAELSEKLEPAFEILPRPMTSV